MNKTSSYRPRKYSRSRDLLQRNKRFDRAKFFASVAFALLASAFIVSTARADSSVDPVDQVYILKEIDLLGRVGLRRTYSSRTVFRGHFGLGWCSDLDARVLLYDARQTRFRGCDIETASLADSQVKDDIKVTLNGFRRQRADGAIQDFNRLGFLVRIVRSDSEIAIHRDPNGRILYLEATRGGRSTYHRVDFEDTTTNENSFGMIVKVEGVASFEYRAGLLIRSNSVGSTTRQKQNLETRFTYDDALNMVGRVAEEAAGSVQETMGYDEADDRLTQVTRRTTAFDGDRLLLTLAGRGKSKIEVRIEVERGAETHPVRFLYDRESKRASVEGDPRIARQILNWMRS